MFCYLHWVSSNSSRRDYRLRTRVNGRASHHVHVKQNSVVYLRCDDVSLGSLRQLEETAAGKRKKKSLHVSCSTKRENKHFRVLVAQRRQRNLHWKSVVHVESCCFANLNLLLFCHSRCHCRLPCLSRRVKRIFFSFISALFPKYLAKISFNRNMTQLIWSPWFSVFWRIFEWFFECF